MSQWLPMTAENSSTCCIYFHRVKSPRAKVTKSKTPTKAKPAKGRSPRQSRTAKGKGQQASKSPPKKTQVASVKDDGGVSDMEVYTFVTILIIRRKCLPCQKKWLCYHITSPQCLFNLVPDTVALLVWCIWYLHCGHNLQKNMFVQEKTEEEEMEVGMPVATPSGTKKRGRTAAKPAR